MEQLLRYPGEINDSQRAQRCPALDVQDEAHGFAGFLSCRLQTTLKQRAIGTGRCLHLDFIDLP